MAVATVEAIRTFGELEYDCIKSTWVVKRAEAHAVIRLKRLFPKLSVAAVFPMELPPAPDVATDMEWFMQRYPMDMTKADRKLLLSQKAGYDTHLRQLEAILLPDYQPHPLKMGDKCEQRHYQLVAAELMVRKKRCILADQLGLGKTITALMAAIKADAGPVAIVSPGHLVFDRWVEEIEDKTNLTFHVIKTRAVYDLPPADVYIFKYSILQGWVDIFSQSLFKTVIFEEVHHLRCQGTNQYNSAMVLSNHAEYVWGVSATPVFNYGDEMWNILNLIYHGCLGTYSEFVREWCTSNGFGKAIVKDPKALGAYLRETHLVIRRTRKDVGRELKTPTVMVITVDHDTSSIKDDEDLSRKLAMKVLNGSFMESGQASRELDTMMRRMTGISKARAVAALVKTLLDKGEKVLLGGWHRSVYEIWLEELAAYEPLMYTGSESATKKGKNKKEFIESVDRNLLIMSIRSGEGVDGLQFGCSCTVMGELDWTNEIAKQFRGRVDRDGQTELVLHYVVITDYGADPSMVDILGLKESQSAGIVDPFEELQRKQQTDPRHIKKLAEDLLKRGGGKGTEIEPNCHKTTMYCKGCGTPFIGGFAAKFCTECKCIPTGDNQLKVEAVNR